MTDELEAISPSTVFISGKAITEDDVMDAIDTVLSNLNDTGNFENVNTAIDTLLGLQRISGKSLAKLLYGAKYWWNNDNTQVQSNFNDYMESRHGGLKAVTIDRYITVWENIQSNSIPPELAERPMRELIPIAKALSQGFVLTAKTIGSLVKATSLGEIGSILRTVKNKPARKSSLQITWDRKGSLYAWKDGQRHFVGMLDKEGYATDEVVKQAINRILDNAGVQKK